VTFAGGWDRRSGPQQELGAVAAGLEIQFIVSQTQVRLRVHENGQFLLQHHQILLLGPGAVPLQADAARAQSQPLHYKSIALTTKF